MATLLKYKQENLPLTTRRLLIYGAPKTGKTALIGQLASKYKLLWLDTESGVDTLMATCSDAELGNVEYIGIKDLPSSPKADETLLRMFESKTTGYICKEHSTWNCPLCLKDKANFFPINMNELTPANGWIIVIDSGTQFGLSAFNHICNQNNITLADGDKASFAIWGVQGAHIDKLGTLIENGKWDVALTAHEVEVEMVDKSKRIVASMGTRKVASSFGKYFTDVIRVYKTAAGHKAASLTTDLPNCETGSRWGIDLAAPNTTIHDFFEMPEDKKGVGIQIKKTAPLGGLKKPLLTK